jgi:hypothetical protein
VSRETCKEYNLRRSEEALEQLKKQLFDMVELRRQRPLTRKEQFDLSEIEASLASVIETVEIQKEAL